MLLLEKHHRNVQFFLSALSTFPVPSIHRNSSSDLPCQSSISKPPLSSIFPHFWSPIQPFSLSGPRLPSGHLSPFLWNFLSLPPFPSSVLSKWSLPFNLCFSINLVTLFQRTKMKRTLLTIVLLKKKRGRERETKMWEIEESWESRSVFGVCVCVSESRRQCEQIRDWNNKIELKGKNNGETAVNTRGDSTEHKRRERGVERVREQEQWRANESAKARWKCLDETESGQLQIYILLSCQNTCRKKLFYELIVTHIHTHLDMHMYTALKYTDVNNGHL